MYDINVAPIVEAIDDGKIVRVPEDYARREGLPIIRRPVHVKGSASVQSERFKPREKGILRFEEFRRPLRADTQRLESELVNNFHWIIQKKRKERSLTRKQLAQSLGASENDLKMLENGVIVGGNFVLVGKVEQFFSISLRKGAGFVNSSKKDEVTKVEKIVKNEEINEEEVKLKEDGLGEEAEIDFGESKGL